MDEPVTEEVLEPEVLPPDQDGGKEETPVTGSLYHRLEKAFGPIIGGIIIDFLDLTTFGPIGLLCGMIVGGAAAYWIC